MVLHIADALSAYQQTLEGAAAGGKRKGTVGDDTGDVGSFSNTLKTFIGDGVKAIKDAEQAAAAGASGKANLQDVVLAVGNAELMLQSFVSVRDKVINAYQDIIRMPI